MPTESRCTSTAAAPPAALLERWCALMREFGFDGQRAMYAQALAAYSEPHRHYHSAAHIEACLDELDEVRTAARSPAEIEIALWFHDIVYAPRATDNERRSADWAARFLAAAGACAGVCERVHAHVMATVHDAAPQDADARLLVDIDLAILGKDADTYDRFERAVRAEYRWVPGPLFRRKRSAILRSFLERASIYATEPFRARYEQAAHANLERAIRALGR